MVLVNLNDCNKEETPFGVRVVIGSELADYDMLVISYRRSKGYVPICFVLPHQLYVHKLEELIRSDSWNHGLVIHGVDTDGAFAIDAGGDSSEQ